MVPGSSRCLLMCPNLIGRDVEHPRVRASQLPLASRCTQNPWRAAGPPDCDLGDWAGPRDFLWHLLRQVFHQGQWSVWSRRVTWSDPLFVRTALSSIGRRGCRGQGRIREADEGATATAQRGSRAAGGSGGPGGAGSPASHVGRVWAERPEGRGCGLHTRAQLPVPVPGAWQRRCP